MKREDIQKAIEKLATKRHVINPEALKAKEALDAEVSQSSEYPKDDLISLDQSYVHQSQKMSPMVIEEFNRSVGILISVFRQSSFDSLVVLLANPFRMMVLNLLIGILRGLGFAIGLILVFGFLAYLFFSYFPLPLFHYYLKFFS